MNIYNLYINAVASETMCKIKNRLISDITSEPGQVWQAGPTLPLNTLE